MKLILQWKFGGSPPCLAMAHILLSVCVFICFLCCIRQLFIIMYFLILISDLCVFVLSSQQEYEPGKLGLYWPCILLSFGNAKRSHHISARACMGFETITLGPKPWLYHLQAVWPIKTHFTSLNFIFFIFKMRNITNTSFVRLLWDVRYMRCLTWGLTVIY